MLIHGFGDTSHMWIPLFDEFGKDYTIIAPDMRGLGDSSRPATGYDKKTIAADIHELVNRLGYEKIDLVGHDIGLMVAYSYAAQYPNKVEKLALLEAIVLTIGFIVASQFVCEYNYSPAKLRADARDASRVDACAPLAQLDRAPDYGSEGWEFESLRARHSNRWFLLGA